MGGGLYVEAGFGMRGCWDRVCGFERWVWDSVCVSGGICGIKEGVGGVGIWLRDGLR